MNKNSLLLFLFIINTMILSELCAGKKPRDEVGEQFLKLPPKKMSMYDMGWEPCAPGRNNRSQNDRLRRLAQKKPDQFRFINGQLWKKRK